MNSTVLHTFPRLFEHHTAGKSTLLWESSPESDFRFSSKARRSTYQFLTFERKYCYKQGERTTTRTCEFAYWDKLYLWERILRITRAFKTSLSCLYHKVYLNFWGRMLLHIERKNGHLTKRYKPLSRFACFTIKNHLLV